MGTRKYLRFLLLAGICIGGACTEPTDREAQIAIPARSSVVLPSSAGLPAVVFDEEEVDLGLIPIGKPVSHTFLFKNTGAQTLQVQSVEPSCGCTAAEYTKEPLLPGGQGFVKAVYNASNSGAFSKTIVFRSNASPATRILVLKGEVVE